METFGCTYGIPKLYIEEKLGSQDKKLRDTLYDGLFGRFYQFMMPFIVMPVRPWSMSWRHWLTFGLTIIAVIGLIVALVISISHGQLATSLTLFILLAAMGYFFNSQRYLLNLLILALPTKLSLSVSSFRPAETFAEAHSRVLAPLMNSPERLQILDVSTGSCNSLYKHGWMDLNADYTAIDLSETMLKQGADMMSGHGIPVDLVLGDAVALPFQPDSFDIVLSYGAVNGLTDPAKAIEEMARVAKPGGLLLFLDEQIYETASAVERAYFQKVLSSHNVIHHCPVETFPTSLTDVKISQVYHFYYICTAYKKSATVI